jgi:hypothetical protein
MIKNIDIDDNLKKIELNKVLPLNCRSAKLIKDNGIDIGPFYKINLVDDANEMFKGDNININQKYFIMGDFKYDSNKEPISYNICGSSSCYVKDIPWDYPCIKKVLGVFCA